MPGEIGVAQAIAGRGDFAIFVVQLVLQAYRPTLIPQYLGLSYRGIDDAYAWQFLTAMFLLGIQTTYNLLQSYNTGTQYATADVLDSLWNYLVGVIMPIAAGLAIIGAIINVATQRPAMRLVGVALALLSVSALWQLVLAMAT